MDSKGDTAVAKPTMADTTFQIAPLDVDGFEALPYNKTTESTMPNAVKESNRSVE